MIWQDSKGRKRLAHMSTTVSLLISIPPFKLISLFELNAGFSAPIFHISSKHLYHAWHEWRAILHLMVSCNTKSQKGVESPSLLGDTSQSRAREDGKKRSRLLCEQGDRSHAYSPFISPTASGHPPPLHIAYKWQRCNGVQESNGNLASIAARFWFTFESRFDCIRWLFNKKKKGKEKQGQDTVGLNLEAPPTPTPPSLPPLPPTPHHLLLSQPAMSFNLPSHYSKWKWKLEPGAFVFEQRERGADYECSNVISITHPLFFY